MLNINVSYVIKIIKQFYNKITTKLRAVQFIYVIINLMF